jgi:hypothetical protein
LTGLRTQLANGRPLPWRRRRRRRRRRQPHPSPLLPLPLPLPLPHRVDRRQRSDNVDEP